MIDANRAAAKAFSLRAARFLSPVGFFGGVFVIQAIDAAYKYGEDIRLFY
ncbi:MAG: hypothetical protein ACRDBM_08335 [Sporomusa sp.]